MVLFSKHTWSSSQRLISRSPSSFRNGQWGHSAMHGRSGKVDGGRGLTCCQCLQHTRSWDDYSVSVKEERQVLWIEYCV